MQIIDNALPADKFEKIHSTMLNHDFPWYYSPVKVFRDSRSEDLNDYQFIHNFYGGFQPRSNHMNLLEPILEVLNPSAIVRIKANLTPRIPDIVIYGYHIDWNDTFIGNTAIFYVNSNDGYTSFENGDKVESVANRLVIFDPKLRHSGTSCTNQKVRCVINFNYYKL